MQHKTYKDFDILFQTGIHKKIFHLILTSRVMGIKENKFLVEKIIVPEKGKGKQFYH